MTVLFEGLRGMANIHPLLVHYPIALFSAFVAAEVLYLIFGNESLRGAASFCLYAATLSAAATVAAGLRAASTVAHTEEVHEIMLVHSYIGTAVLVLGIILSAWRLFTGARFSLRGRLLHIAGGLVLVAVMSAGADLGGLMVYRYGVAVKAVPVGSGHVHSGGHHHEDGHHHESGESDLHGAAGHD